MTLHYAATFGCQEHRASSLSSGKASTAGARLTRFGYARSYDDTGTARQIPINLSRRAFSVRSWIATSAVAVTAPCTPGRIKVS
jgi:hypothetical protein